MSAPALRAARLGPVHLLEHVRRQAADAVEIFHRSDLQVAPVAALSSRQALPRLAFITGWFSRQPERPGFGCFLAAAGFFLVTLRRLRRLAVGRLLLRPPPAWRSRAPRAVQPRAAGRRSRSSAAAAACRAPPGTDRRSPAAPARPPAGRPARPAAARPRLRKAAQPRQGSAKPGRTSESVEAAHMPPRTCRTAKSMQTQ